MTIWALDRLFEPPSAIIARERDKEAALRQNQGDPDGDPPIFRCRVCGHEWADPGYCPECLADTMEKVTVAPPGTR